MTRRPVALAIALAFAASASLTACDSTASLTEQEHIQRAKDFEDKGDIKGGIIELKNALQKNPNSAQARLLLGQVYLKAGRGAEAEKELNQARKLGVNAESITHQLGEALLLMGEYERVMDEILPGAQSSDANRAKIFQLRADALLKQGKIKLACDLFQQSLDTGVKHPEAYWGLANCAIAERNTDKAEEWLDAALKMDTKQAKTWVYKGDLDRLRSNTAGALEAYANALRSEPNNLEALERRADSYLTLGQIEPAQKDFNRLRQVAPKSISASYLDAAIKFQQENYAEAQEALQEGFKVSSNHLPSLLLAAKTAYALGSHQQAETYLNRIFTQVPGHAATRKMLAAIQIKQDQFSKALETLSPLLASNTQDIQALTMAGEASLKENDTAKAMIFLGQASTLDPQNLSVKTQLAALHLAEGKSGEALPYLKQATTQNAKASQADLALIMLHMQRKEYDQALHAIADLEKKLPNNPVTHNLRAGALIAKKDRAGARKAFEKALAIQADFTPALSNLAQLDLMDGQTEKARTRYMSILKTDRENLDSMLALADISLRVKDEKGYLGWIEKAINAHPNALPPNSAMAQYLLSQGETNKAVALARRLVNSSPDDPEALKLLGHTQLAARDSANAITTFATLVKKTNQSPDAYQKLALAQVADGKLSDARTTLHRALQVQPDHLQSQIALIQLELADKKPEIAMQVARQIQKNLPQSSIGYEREADIHLAQTNLSPAIKALEQALSKGADSNALIKLHQTLIRAGHSTGAEQRLQDWLKQRPVDHTVRAQLAEYLMDRGRNKDAISHYHVIQQKRPTNLVVLNNLATLYQREKDPRALATAELAFKHFPNVAEVQDTLGWILVERGQAQRGLQVLRKALSKAPRNATIRYHHAVALARTGDKAQARKELNTLLKDFPTFQEHEAATGLLKRL